MSDDTDWLGVGMGAWSLYLDAMTVIGLRSLKVARGGPAAQREATKMVSEKIQSTWELGLAASTGDLGLSPAGAAHKVVRHYQRKVGANKARLSKR